MPGNSMAVMALALACLAGCKASPFARQRLGDLAVDSGLEKVTVQISGLRCLP